MCQSVLQCRKSRILVIIIAFLAFFLDKCLITIVVPIIPNVLKESSIVPNNNKTSNNYTLDQSDFRGNASIVTQLSKQRVSQTASSRNNNNTNRSHQNVPQRNEVRIGLLFASKAIVQVCVNPVVGTIANRIGYAVPMFTGLIIIAVSTLTFAFGESYWTLLFARAIQGVGSSCSSVGAMSMIADIYTDDQERGNAIGTVLGGLALGFLIGPPFGGFMYQLFGKETPFLVLSCLALVIGILQCFVLFPFDCSRRENGPSVLKLLKDPYVMIIAGCLIVQNFALAITEPTLPSWMDETMNSPVWQQGLVFLPSVITYVCVSKVVGLFSNKMGRWIVALIGMILTGVCLVPIPFAKNTLHLIGPIALMGIAAAMVDAALLPQLGYIVDIRHTSVYGSVYAIADMSLGVGFCIGPAVSGVIVEKLGFDWLMWMFAIISVIYAPFMVLIRNPSAKDDEKSLIPKECPTKYGND